MNLEMVLNVKEKCLLVLILYCIIEKNDIHGMVYTIMYTLHAYLEIRLGFLL